MLLILLVQNRLYQNFHKRRRTREDRRKGYHSSKRTKEQAHHHQVTLLLFVKGFTILLFFCNNVHFSKTITCTNVGNRTKLLAHLNILPCPF